MKIRIRTLEKTLRTILTAVFFSFCCLLSFAEETRGKDSEGLGRLSIPETQIHQKALDSICRQHIISGEYEIAMNEAVSIVAQSEKAGHVEGVISGNENIGLIYLLMGQNKEAVPSLEKSLSLLRELNELPIYQTHIMSYLLAAYYRLGEFGKMKGMLNLYQAQMDQIAPESDYTRMDEQRKTSWLLFYSYYINYFVATGDMEKAEEMKQKATTYMDESFEDSFTSVYYLAMSRYYLVKKDYEMAVLFINKTLGVDYSEEPLEERIKILTAAGKEDDVLSASQELLELLQKQNIKVYTRQIDQLRTIHDLNEKEKQNQLYLRQEQELEHKQSQLVGIWCFGSLLAILLVGLIYYSIRERRLKNDLVKEKESLKRSSEDLLIAKEEAEYSDRMKSKFVANISHEIRTPLNAIMGFSNMLEFVDEDDRQEFIGIINTNAELLLKLVRDVLDLSQIEAGKFTLNIQETDIDQCCKTAMAAISTQIKEGVKLTYTHPETPFVTKTDSLRVQQILFNLLINAAKYTEDGFIHLDYRIDDEQKQIIFTVTDTGCGVPPEKQKIIFQSFEKADDFIQGAGLGLSVCEAISSRLNGKVSIDPSYTEGARFTFVMDL